MNVIRLAILYWLLCAITLAVGAWLVCPGAVCSVPGLDHLGLASAHDLRGNLLDWLMPAVTWLGSLFLLLPLAGAVAAWLFVHRRRKESGFLLLGMFGATALAQLGKLWVARPRPELFAFPTLMPGDASFPSAHSMQATALGMAMFIIMIRQRPEWGVPLALVLSTLVLLVGLSRIYLQVHFPSDVIAGLFAGAFWVLGLHALMFCQPAKSDRDNATEGSA